MAYVALITWFCTILAGLYMLAVWLIENDAADGNAAASELRAPVIITHLLLAVAGLCVWVAYLILDRRVLAWGAVTILGMIALLGVAMFARWIPASREPGVPVAVAAMPAAPPSQPAPPESNFPLVVVAGHGLLALSTVVLVLLTTLGVGGS
jgi:hypothetical protein